MALRGAHAILGTFIRAGVLCLGSGRTCIDLSGLPEIPDTFSAMPVHIGSSQYCLAGWYLESWDANTAVFVNSFTAIGLYCRIAVEFATIQ